MNPSLILGSETHSDLAQLLQANRRLIISGVSNETAKSLVYSALLNHNPAKTICITQHEEDAYGLQHWFEFFGKTAVVLMPVQTDRGIDTTAFSNFIKFTTQTDDTIYITTNTTYEVEFPLITELEKQKITLQIGATLEFTSFIEQIIAAGYNHGKDLYLAPGEYRRNGDVLDIYPLQAAHSYRISFAFDTIETIHSVDRLDLSALKETNEVVDLYPSITTRKEPLRAQVPANVTLLLDDQDDLTTPLDRTTVRFTSFPEAQENHAHLRYLSILKFYTLGDFLNDLRDKLNQGWALTVVSKRSEELAEIFTEERIQYVQDGSVLPRAVTLVHAKNDALLPHSLQNPDLKIALLTDREIFSLKKANKNRSVQKMALDFITSLVPGDFVVHMEHGIGYFEGMTEKQIDTTTREYLELSYAEGDKLFVPVDQADKLSKYTVEEGMEPRLTRLGTQEWKKTMGKVKAETEQLARELLEIYAKRAKSTGYKYDEDTKDQLAFEKAFPYQETPGQIKAIEDIKNDMEDTHPMDRLVCGDVGFGKTEVAMRAAFKAAKSGKQVAVIAPITILAQQHFINFSERMAGFNIHIDMMSRFQTKAEQAVTIKKLKKGDVNIVIGTHRLLQTDIEFLNLGLVIIDEEQRFGVKQKERFKEMRSSVDILTMTATPIPRTLNLGLHKLRDISTITTPPPGRLPIITEVRKFSDSLVRQAILAEIKRGGQSYVLYNKVESIESFTKKLRELIPEAKFIVAHGQLKPEDLETRIVDFKAGKYDVLVSSTIIENGIDLPRANTLIVNEAERFGLSQLYQLRGRVGRGSVQAYAYFLYHTQRLKDDAKKRLRAIVEACELGSGFQVAMRDLEIRGAGEVLGSSQSGNMQTIGVSHYLKMLKTAMDELQYGSITEEEITTEILLPIEALLPKYYITDEQERISIYQKLAGSENEEILNDFADDLQKEYGDLPVPVQNLFHILRLKLTCKIAGVTRIKMEEMVNRDPEIVVQLHNRVTAAEIMQILTISPQWRIVGSTLRIRQPEITRNSGLEPLKWLPELRRHLEALKPKKPPLKKKKASQTKDE